MPFTPFLAVLGPQDLLDMLVDTTLLGKTVLLLLMILSVLSWAVMFDKGRALSRIRKGHREFWQRLASWREGREPVTSLTAWCEERVDLPLANLWLEAAPQKSAVMVRRACERTAYAETEELERYLIILSTTVTISPFLGLMGTVWGIMQSFTEMGSGTSTTLNLIGPGIAEALITTIAGLTAAIPAVVFYNLFVRKIDLVGNEMERLRSILEEEVIERTGQNTPRQRPTRRPDTHDEERIR